MRDSASRVPLAVGLILAAVSVSSPGAAGAAESSGRPPSGTLGSLPATFAGLVPCADCAGIRYQIDLLPRGVYLQRKTYLRSGQDHSFHELGVWSLSDDGRTLALDGGKGRAYWSVQSRNALRMLDRAGKPIDSELPYTLARRTSAEPVEARVKLLGVFRYLADAARFRDCHSGLQMPVAMSDDYLALERAYNAGRGSPGAELLVTVEGRIERRRRVEGEGTELTLVVEKYLGAKPGEACPESWGREGLENNRWRLVRIGDRRVTIEGDQREPWIVLEPRSKRVTGSGGCNRISGSYKAVADSLRFASMISTKMACPSMETESAFLRALENTRFYRVAGRTLELLDGRRRPLARLEEANLK